jgi:hypothetical protein
MPSKSEQVDQLPELNEFQQIMLSNLQAAAQSVISGKLTSLGLICGQDEAFNVQYAGSNLAGLKTASDQLSKMLLEEIFKPQPPLNFAPINPNQKN